MIFKNALVFAGSRDFIRTDVTVENGVITSLSKTEAQGIDCADKVILPGFIDIHIHGCNFADATDGRPQSADEMSAWLVRHGVTSFCPATMTLPESELEKAFAYIGETMGRESGAYIHGINMEGPFISPAKKGAQATEYIREPDYDMFARLNALCPVKLVDIAPEMPGAYDFAEKASQICTVSLAHTAADYETAALAEKHGVTHATHLFNAMTPLTSREPGAVGAVLASGSMTAELICDGIHIAPATLKVAFKALGEDRSVLISDAMMAAGLDDGEYTLGGQRVIKKGAARLADGTLAGSVTNLFDEFRNIVSYGIPVRQAVKSATINPAKVIGADSFTGSIDIGKNADLLILDEAMKNIAGVCVKGEMKVNLQS